MSTALYRTHRPQTFADLMGQEHITNILEKAAKDGSISHAYLFSGSRGTGKTSTARILARLIGTLPDDLYELDGASNNGVDEVRELREQVRVLPFSSPQKVYIIDEVHMLSKAAFNALLKTLEEPPAHVVFMLATTEPHKLPDTVVSRCQHFHFKRPTEDILARHVEKIAKKEGYSIEAEASALIAMLGDGSYRDTLTVLQQVLSSVEGKETTHEHVVRVTGAPSQELVRNVVLGLVDGNLDLALASVTEASRSHLDIKVFTKLIMRELRHAMLIVLSPTIRAKLEVELSPGSLAFLRLVGEKGKGRPILVNSLRELLIAYDQISLAAVAHLPLELALVGTIGDQEEKHR